MTSAGMHRERIGHSTLVMIAAAGLLSVAAIVLLVWRANQTGQLHFAFLVWNLFLAWTPLPFAALLWALRRSHPVLLVMPIVPWLSLLPNAPYLVTDFVHLRPRPGIPLWADAVLIGTFAAAGLAAGLVSLHLVHRVIEQRFGRLVGWISVACFAGLSAVGVYIGRELRFNSWDLLHRSDELVGLALIRLADPLGNPELLQMVGAMVTVLVIGYGLLHLAWRGFRRAA